jgi:hypothetical protein
MKATKKLKKRFTPAQREAMFEPTYVFGYGSLLLAYGVNGRGMDKQYKNSDLIPCELRGYKRSFCGFFGGRNFYGILENKKAVCNGVVFKIDTWRDYRAFLNSEGSIAAYRDQRTYWPIRVTDNITGWEVPENHRVMTLLCKEDKISKGRAEPRYISLCHEGARIWGPKFEKRFLATGGVPYNKKRLELKKIAALHGLKIW